MLRVYWSLMHYYLLLVISLLSECVSSGWFGSFCKKLVPNPAALIRGTLASAAAFSIDINSLNPYTDSLYADTLRPAVVYAAESSGSTELKPKISLLDRTDVHYAPYNIQSDDFWYPPFLIGRWDVSLNFKTAEFTGTVPIDTLSMNNNLPGFTKYSIFPIPEIGKDVDHLQMRFVQLDSHPREDHPHNLRQRVTNLSPTTIIDAAPYSFQKAPFWWSSPANQWRIKYHDETGSGDVQLSTRKRQINTFAGTVETTEYFSQKHSRSEKTLSRGEQISDYAIQWQFSVPEATDDVFLDVQRISKADRLVGKLNVYAFFQPTNDLYFKRPGVPAGVYSYDIEMTRLGDDRTKEVQDTVYPFVWRSDGPIELDQYFGY